MLKKNVRTSHHNFESQQVAGARHTGCLHFPRVLFSVALACYDDDERYDSDSYSKALRCLRRRLIKHG